MAGSGRTFRWPWRERSEIQREVDEEIRFHLEMRTQELLEQGLEVSRAKELAEREFGSLSLARRTLASMDLRLQRERRRLEWIRELSQDVGFAIRTLRLNPTLTLLTLLTLALGVGVNSSIFSVVNSVLFTPLPFLEEDQLVSVWPEKGLQKAEYQLLKRTGQHYRSLSLYQAGSGFSLTSGGESARLTGALVSGDLFETLPIVPLMGRTLQPTDQLPGAAPVVLIAENLWRTQFGRRSDILSIEVELDGRKRSIVGVLPTEFSFPQSGTEIWVPLTFNPGDGGDYWGNWGGYAVGRLLKGKTPQQAEQELRSLAQQMRLQNPLWTPLEDYGRHASVVNLRSQMVGDVRPLLLLVLGAVVFVLLVACANVGNLLLAKGLSRQRELALRAALGASRGRLVRQLLTESLVLGLGAGFLGFLFVWLGETALLRLLPADLPRSHEISIDYRVFMFTLTIALATGILAGLLPALRVVRSDLHGRLLEGGRSGVAQSRSRLSRPLVAIEISLAVMLVSCAGLLSHSFLNLWETDTGFRRRHTIRAVVSPPELKYQSPEKQRRFYARLLTRLREVAGVNGVALSSQVPFDSRIQRAAIFIEGVTENPNDLPMFDLQHVSANYFEVMGIPLLRGRVFAAEDRAGAPAVAIIDEGAARAFFAGVNPIGKRLGRPWLKEQIPIVGVVGSVRNHSLAGAEHPAIYLSIVQTPAIEARLVLKTELDPDDLAPTLRSLVTSLDPEVPLSRIHTHQEAIEATLGKPGLAALLLLSFSLLALLLGGIGIYGIVSYSVSQRTSEIGVRMALGASAGDVTRMFLREALLMSGVGILLGIVGSLALSPLLEGFLYGIEGHDARTLGQGILVLSLVSLLAGYLPARKAVRLDPLQALRQE